MANPNYIPKYIYSDYLNWEGDWELIKGSPVSMSPSPKKKHQLVSGKVFNLFSKFLDENRLNCDCNMYYELDWKVSNDTVVRPDLMIVCNEKDTDFVENTPSLIVEILSSSTHLKDRNTKFSIYEQCGVPYYIMIDSETQNIEIFQLIDNRYKEVHITNFVITRKCALEVDLETIFQV